ncbi:Oidioi.mRNA.OKI2018_I69.PAR.g10260.t1.cds [Oikopleura dioica]|uniref:Oidioi.mRNA.OKI2018_I69.PAR.g10260.t1.cds n=1 Tax=Oikopleura dioica TaxID=34765 RepID=A0ABN7RU69_OIKDI|nr:Oidioi.mRNA.OKI2018_I69.PAR.g10260.t1.cds [Oikopleura dioica]
MSHRLGCVGLFKGDITAVGSADLNMAHSVEQLKTTTTYSRGKGGYGGWWRKRRKRWADEYDDRYWGGSRYTTTTVNWEKVSDFFNNDEPSHGKQCIGLDDESMIALGGFDNGGKSIYILKNNWEQKWVQLSSFQHAYFNPAVAAFDDVYLIVGRNSVERLYYDSYTSKAALSSFVLPIDFKSEHYLAYNL